MSLLLVIAQVVLSAAIVLSLPWQFPPPLAWLTGLPLLLVGGGLGLWSWLCIGWLRLRIMPEPGAGARLVQSGPYAFVRHPMYTGLLLFMLGGVLLAPTLVRGSLWFLLWIVLDRKATHEEKLLQLAFSDYQAYQQRTGKFIPRRSAPPADSDRD